MTPEDEEFNRVEMESRIKQEYVRAMKREMVPMEAVLQMRDYISYLERGLQYVQKRLADVENGICQRAFEKKWVGLTRDDQSFVYRNIHNATSREDSFWVDFANAIEAKLKEKNND